MKLTRSQRAAGLIALAGIASWTAIALSESYVVSGFRLRAPDAAMALRRTAVALAEAVSRTVTAGVQSQGPTERSWQVTAARYKFNPSRIEVLQDDLVTIELRTDDIAHSLTIDAYRIAKRVSPGQPVTFEFRADQAGTFPFYCNLQIEDGCRQMRGELVVKPRK